MRVLWAAIVLAIVAPTLASLLRTSPNWDPDGFLYVRMMLVDRGMSEEQAYAQASTFYLSRTPPPTPHTAVAYGAHPPHFFVTQYALFRARKLYPWIASLLYPYFGIMSLWIVSAVAIALAALGLYAILLFTAPPWLAALGAVAGTGYAVVREVASGASTDSVAFLLWTICLAAMLAYARRPGIAWLCVAVAAALAMGVTRPAIWIPPGAAAGFMVYAYRRGDAAQRAAALRLFGAQIAVAIVALAYTAAQHGAGFFDLLNWQYAWHTERHGHWIEYGIAGWYALFALRGFVYEPVVLASSGTALLAIPAAAIGLWRRRADAAVALLAGTVAIAPLAIFANPPDFQRALELPLVPVVMFGIVALLADGIRAPARVDASPARG